MGPLSEFGDMTVFPVGWRFYKQRTVWYTAATRFRPRRSKCDMNQPVMDHWTTVKRIHLDVDPSERAAFVHESCGGGSKRCAARWSPFTLAAEAEVRSSTGGGNRGHPAG